ncbi:hypothetical protein OG349_23145 [Streptomyces sp. NBC_01317]|uniref:hypothetical protein n=1 Tax=Streptomyces sp. NBC_01317 TaxID=2903822 RepID=UPI002E0DCB4F|nr:hypothetical protein OG349_23145 [Streptomyces sp. NBC_01317]
MLTFNDVYLAPLGKLKTAADDWSAMTGKLEKLAEDARTTMAAKARDDLWQGANATVTKPFIDKTAKEFDDAAKAAKGIQLILEDGHRAFKKAKDDLRAIVETDARAQYLVVDAAGRVTAAHPVQESVGARHDPDYADILRSQNARIEALQRRIDAIVETCEDADVATANALRANITGDRHNFSAPQYESLDAEEARRAADLAKKGSDLTHTELRALNELLADNHGSKEFSRGFYDGVGGPEKALEFFGRLSTDTYDYTEQDKERLADVQALQRNLGLNLATATTSDDTWARQWGDEMRKLGTERIPLSKNDYSGPYGYQLLGGIMRFGNYDAKFLNPIAEHVTQLHAKDPYLFAGNKSDLSSDKYPFNPSGKNGAGYDPVISMLEALGHSSDASKEFFSATPRAYDEDGVLVGGLPKDADGKELTSYLDHFGNKDYESFPDITGHSPDDAEKSLDDMPDAFGHALESATLGHAWDDPHPRLVRDETSAGIMEQVVEKYGGDPALLKQQAAMADSLGNMGAGYVDDINWALNDNEPSSLFSPSKDASSHAVFGRDGARDFLSTLGQHPDAYASVTNAERIYTGSVLDAQVHGGEVDSGRAREAVRTGAEVQGMLDQSRADQIGAEGAKKNEDYAKAMERRSGWIELGTGAVVGAGIAFLPISAPVAGLGAVLVPLAVDTATGGVEQYANQILGDWAEPSQEQHTDDIDEQTRKDREAVFNAGERNVEAPMKAFLAHNGIDPNSVLGQDLEEAVDGGYLKGKDRENASGNSPETG